MKRNTLNFPSFSYQTKYYSGPSLFLIKTLDNLLQPFMNFLGNRKVTHIWHWQPINALELQESQEAALQLFSRKKQKRNFRKSILTFPRNAIADLGWVVDAAIIEPEKYEGEWSFLFQDMNSDACQECTLLHKGAVKILIDGDVKAWGRGEEGRLVKLKLVRMTTIKSDQDVLFI